MNSKLTFGELVNLLALRSGFSRRICEDFLKSLFSTVTTALENGENVRIKGFGSFRITEIGARKSVNVTTGEDYEIPPHRRVSFLPSKELAAAVNLPFEAFEAVEISDDISDSELEEAGTKPLSSPNRPNETQQNDIPEDSPEQQLTAPEAIPAQESDATEEYDLEAESDENTEDEPEAEAKESQDAPEENAVITAEPTGDSSAALREPEMEIVVETIVKASAHESAQHQTSVIPSDADSTSETSSHVKPKKPDHRIWAFLIGMICGAVLAIVGITLASRHGIAAMPEEITEAAAAQTEDETVLAAVTVTEEEALPQKPDTIKPVEKRKESAAASVDTKASDAPVYDTISTTRYLTTMAKEHYGNYNLWPYIYEENKAILGHPDRIRPGTRVVVPPLSKYGVNPANPDDIAKAKRMGVEIYARYK